MGCYIGYSEEGPGWAAAPPRPLLTVPLVVDGWAVTLGTARRGLGGLQPHPDPSLLYHWSLMDGLLR